MKRTTQIQSFFRRFILYLLATLLMAQTGATESNSPRTVLSFEGAYFIPRRQDFKELYGEGLPVVGARVDFGIKERTSFCIKGRYFRMTKKEYDRLSFTNISLGLLLKREFPENEITDFFVAGGVQIEYRAVKYDLAGMLDYSGYSIIDSSWYQWEIAPSVAVEGGFDLWLSRDFKFSPNIGFNYFPLGDPTRGDFGDTGGFMFAAGFGFRL